MVGNDVVDLADGESNAATLHPRFDGRVFGEREQRMIAESGDSNRERWSLWAAKEAAYKLARKLDPTTIFSPRRFDVVFCEPIEDANGPTRRGRVSHVDGRRFEVRVEHGDRWLHALARPSGSPGPRPIWDLARLERAPSKGTEAELPGRAARALALREIARHLCAHPDELAIERRRRIPHLLMRGRPAPLDLSLSHHGLFVAFACRLSGSVDARPGA